MSQGKHGYGRVCYYSHGAVAGRVLFPDEVAARFFRGRLEGIARFEMLTILACRLTPDACYLLIRQDGCEPADVLPRKAAAAYVKYYNRRYAVHGPLFGRKAHRELLERGWDVTRLVRGAFPGHDGEAVTNAPAGPAWIDECVPAGPLRDYVEARHAAGWKDDTAEWLAAHGFFGE